IHLARLSPLTKAFDHPPNIVFLIADDLGYGDIGPFGQKKIKTPTLDKLAADGMKLTRHYSGNPVCATSRCVLMTGKHPGHAQIRDNRETKPEGQYPLLPATKTLARILNENGYTTGGFGKWGLGGPESPGRPVMQGFDRFFGYNCQARAHNFYPTYLWDNDTKVELRNKPFPAHQKFPANADINDPSAYSRYQGLDYAPDLITDQALKFIEENQAKPFFLYYPTTVPHLALQVPDEALAVYKGKFPEIPYDGSRSYLPNIEPRATYAAMVTRMDAAVGRLLQKIEELGLTDNTIIVFTSDNGPLYDKLGGTDTEFFESAGDLRGRKGSVYEGGIRVPTLVKFSRHIARGAVSDRVTGFEDWMPTLLNLAGLSSRTPADTDGIDFSQTLAGKNQPERDFLYREFPGYGGQQAVWAGRWKAVRQNLNRPVAGAASKKVSAKKKVTVVPDQIITELYDLQADPTESRNIAANHPEIVKRLESIMISQHQPSAVFPMRLLDAKITSEN
ncbi:MAG: sulfatase-like hydrolase/transferase, partial [bacterium]